MTVQETEQVARVGARMQQALLDECTTEEAKYLRYLIPGLHESWQRFCQGIISNNVSDGAELEELFSDGEFWPEIPSVTTESGHLRNVFALVLGNFQEWDEWARYLDRDDDEEDDE